jgi:hypothetical protein
MPASARKLCGGGHDGVMRPWNHGDLYPEFERRLDEILAEVSPGWIPEGELLDRFRDDERLYEYCLRDAKRQHLGDVLKARRDVAAERAEAVLAAVVCDEDVSFNKQLLLPVMAATGRRHVQTFLIAAVENEPPHKKVCAAHAWYWSQVSLHYLTFDDYDRGCPTSESRAADEEVADLRARYRNACLAAFVACDHAPTRERLDGGFQLVEDLYPPDLHHLVRAARAVADADPERYHRLLDATGDGPGMAHIGSGGS